MIDIHCHVIPYVDDGATSLEEALKMLEMAKEDGIEQVIVTPHYNHPMDFKSTQSIEASFKIVEAEVKKWFPKMKIYLGAEFYVRENYLYILDNLPCEIRMNQTNYILIEFPRNVKKQQVIEAIYEFKIRGYEPIIAHIEMYPHLIQDLRTIEELKKEGAHIQITGSSLLGKQGKENMLLIRKLLQIGLIDFIATDAHGENKRRMRLKKAYQMVQRLVSDEEAKRIFEKNPQALLEGKRLYKPKVRKTHYRSNRSKLNLIAGTLATALLFIIGLAFFSSREDRVNNNELETQKISRNFLDSFKWPIQEIVAKEATSGIEEVEYATIENCLGEPLTADILKEEFLETTSNQINDNEVKIESSVKEIIEKNYRNELESLKVNYEYQLELIVGEIQIARDTIKDANKKQKIIQGYLDEIVNLESISDNKVYQLLYDMQNELEEGRYSVEEVFDYREEYHNIKEQKKTEYLERLKNE
jgi:protein-tyrosine phosphatase